MTLGEILYLALILGAFVVYGATLSIVAWRTERHLRRQAEAARHRVEHDAQSMQSAA